MVPRPVVRRRVFGEVEGAKMVWLVWVGWGRGGRGV